MEGARVKVIGVQIRRHYGQEYIYAVDQEIRDCLRQLTGKRTLNREDVANLRKLGLTVNLVQTDTL